ncbi:MAG: ABC transporter substrate-binding protein [Candidatus Lambdaproteobacteria bacterium]|nr:ABC transporter substrate-binding protein [Candidatus Lambdaproteobacteria bacterium]
MKSFGRTVLAVLLAGAAVFAWALPASLRAAPVEYNVAGLADYSGPYADVMPLISDGRKAVFTWWNKEVGAKLGVQLNFKEFDTRYDTAQTASLWPGVLADLKPIMIMGLGGPDVAALRQRLPDDKVPLLMSTAAYGFAWQPETWFFNPRPTYAHEAVAFAEWYRGQKGAKTLKVAVISSEASPAYIDIAKGIEKYASMNPTVEVVETVYTAVQPTDLSSQIRRVVRKGAEALLIQTNTAVVVASKRGLEAAGQGGIPLMMSSHNGLAASGKALGGLEQLEGSFEVYGIASPADTSGSAYKFYEMLRNDFGVKAPWNILAIQGTEQALYSVRAVEQAVKKVGAANLTGSAVREGLYAGKIPSEATFGFLPDLTFTREGPFPVRGLTANITTVKGGKYTLAAANVPVPVVEKW